MHVYLLPNVVYTFLDEKLSKERKIFYVILASINFLKSLPIFFINNYHPISEIVEDFITFIVILELTILITKSYKKLKPNKKNIAIAGTIFIWSFFLFGIGKYFAGITELKFNLFFVWGIQFTLMLVAVFTIYYSLKFLIKRTGSEKAIESSLTSREKQIVDLVLLGLSNKDIAQKLYVSDNTVKKHPQNTYSKLGIKSKLQLFSIMKKDTK